MVRENGVPSRFYRFCCKNLKEYKIGNRNVQGVRRAESVKRAKRYHEPEVCRTYSKGEKVKIYLPILEWTNEDVAEFIAERGIKCHPLYYDEQGNFHVERRLGCIGCPLQADNGRGDFLKYPKMLLLWIKNFQIYLDNHPSCGTMKKFAKSAHHVMFFRLFCKSYAEYKSFIGGGMFPETAIDAKSFMEEYFKIDLTI